MNVRVSASSALQEDVESLLERFLTLMHGLTRKFYCYRSRRRIDLLRKSYL